MKKLYTISTLALVFGLSGQAFAQMPANQGAIVGVPHINQKVVSVAEAKDLSDDTQVSVTGKITAFIGDEKYSLTDATGTIMVEIDNEALAGQTISGEDTVQLNGEIDKDWNTIKIDVDSVVKK